MTVTLGAPGRALRPEAAPTVGVEEEFLLLRPDGSAACVAPELLATLGTEVRARGGGAPYRIEIGTEVCTELPAVARELSVARRVLAQAAADLGARLVATGTPPFGAPGPEVTCACRVHVGVPDREVGLAVLGRLRPWLPALLALTGNSPLWRGRDTGWSSYRFVVRRRPAAVPERDGHRLTRLSPRHPTVEIRLPDTCPTVTDAVLVTGLCRALVGTAVADELAGRPGPDVPGPVLAAALSAAALRGDSALVVAPGDGRPAPAREVVDQLLRALTPALAAAGDRERIADLLAERLRRGSGADRQRALWRLGRREVAVQALANLCAGLDPGIPVPLRRPPAGRRPATGSG